MTAPSDTLPESLDTLTVHLGKGMFPGADAGVAMAAPAPAPSPVRVSVLREALEIVDGDRDTLYGDPTENHTRAAAIFNAIAGRELSAADIAMVQIAVKLARLHNRPGHRDSHVDLAGYAALLAEITQARD